MSIEITSLDSIQESDVQDKQAILIEIIKEKYPELDISRGALRDIVLYLHAVLAAKTSEEINRYKSARSLLAITQDPTLAEDGVVDNVLSNYNLVRKSATFAKGKIRLVYESDNVILVPIETEFTVNDDVYYVTDGIVIGDTEADDHFDTKLTKLKNGTYSAVIDVVARKAGVLSPVTKGSTIATDLQDVIDVIAEEDFVPGKDEESNASLMNRLADGMATPCWGNRQQITALIFNNVDSVIAVSVVGFGDPEMQRDKLTIFPISVGGKADIYVKTSIDRITKPFTASFFGMEGTYERWDFNVPSNTFPGCYRVEQVSKDLDTITVSNQTVTSGYDFTTSQSLNVSVHSEDVKVVRPYGTQETFDVTLVGQIDIDKVQDLFEDRNLMPVTEDALVRSAFPAWTTVNLTLSSYENNEGEISSAIQKYINETGFVGKLLSSELIKAVSPFLKENQQILQISMSCEIWGPENIVYRTNGTQILTLPTYLETSVSEKTTVFYCEDVVFSYFGY